MMYNKNLGLLCYNLSEFNKDTFTKDIKDIFFSDDFKIGVTYYMSLTDINGKILGVPTQFPFLLVNLNYKDKLTIDLYDEIYKKK